MKLKYTGPFTADIPALRLVGVEPGADLEVVDEVIASSLLRQGFEPVDKAAKVLAGLLFASPAADTQEG